MNGLIQWLFPALVFSALPLGCAGTAAGATRSPVAEKAQAEDTKKPKPGRSASALAYEHYLKARLLMESGKQREAVAQLRQALVYDHGSTHLHVALGRLYARQGLWRMAAAEAKAALDMAPDDVAALMLHAASLHRDGRGAEAVEVYQRVIALDPQRIRAYTQLAKIFLKQKPADKDKAVWILKEMVDKNPASAEGFRALGDLSFEQGDEAEAEKYYRRVLQVEPSDTRTTQTLAGLLEQQGRYAESIKVFVEALESLPENPYYMAYMARLYLKSGDLKAADAYIAQLRAADPSNAGLIARAYAEINRHEEAITELERVLKENPNEHNERLLLAILYEELKRWEPALEHLKRIPSDSRLFITAQTSIGYCLHHMDRPDEARRVLESVLPKAKEPDEIGRIYRNLAEVYTKQKRFDAGLAMLDKALGVHPALTELFEAKANLLFQAGRGPQGIKVLEGAIKESPESVSLLYALGALYEQLGKIDESLEAMRRLLALDPHNSSALNFIGYTMADQGRDLDEAERLIRRALLLNPGNGAITDSLGWLLYKRARYDEALDYLQRADRTTPGEPVIIMHVGDAYLKLGQRDKATEYYRRALAAGPEERDRAEIMKRFEQLGIDPTGPST